MDGPLLILHTESIIETDHQNQGNARLAEAILTAVRSTIDVTAVTRAAVATLPFSPGLVLGGGKAAVRMIPPVIEAFPSVPGALAVREMPAEAGRVECVLAGHPFPDEGSVAAVERQEALMRNHSDPALFLLSGGATAMLGAPLAGLSLADLRQTYRALLASGLDIESMNIVRRHLTRWGGGKLAGLLQRPVHVLVISDVKDDSLRTIGSGPLAPDDTTFGDALGILERVAGGTSGEGVPSSALALCRAGVGGEVPETRPSGDPCFEHVGHRILLSNRTVVASLAERMGKALGADFPLEVSPFQDDDVDTVAANWAYRLRGGTGLWIAGGEPGVSVTGDGQGGRNQHLVLRVGQLLREADDWLFLSIATDGADGNSPSAGAWMDSSVARGSGDEIQDALARFDSGGFCGSKGLAFQTGPTGSNVADIQIGIAGASRLRQALRPGWGDESPPLIA